MPKYFVTKKCFWSGRLWNPDSALEKDRVYVGGLVPPADKFTTAIPAEVVAQPEGLTMAQVQEQQNGTPAVPQIPVVPEAPAAPAAPAAIAPEVPAVVAAPQMPVL